MIEHIKYLWRDCRYCERHRFICMTWPCVQRISRNLHVFADGRHWTGHHEDRLITDRLGRQWECVSNSNPDVELRHIPMRPFDEAIGCDIGDSLNLATMPTPSHPGLGNICYRRVL